MRVFGQPRRSRCSVPGVLATKCEFVLDVNVPSDAALSFPHLSIMKTRESVARVHQLLPHMAPQLHTARSCPRIARRVYLSSQSTLFPSSHCTHPQQRQLPSQRRAYAATAAGAAVETSPPSAHPPPSPTAALNAGIKPIYNMHASVVLSRPPLITRTLHPFEQAYYLYQKRLNERTVLPFSRYFYIKKGTPADLEWKRKIRDRPTPARDVGLYNAYGREAWNDEVLVGDETAAYENIVGKLVEDAETVVDTSTMGQEIGAANGGGAGNADIDSGNAKLGQATGGAAQIKLKTERIERPQPRRTKADEEGDLHSLDRALERTLYLVVKDAKGEWSFPGALVKGREGLNKVRGLPFTCDLAPGRRTVSLTMVQAAERVIFESAGANLNTWVVGHAPVGHLAKDYEAPVFDETTRQMALGDKVFFMKARIMAGQVDLSKATLGYADFRWLTREEIQPLVSKFYWRYTENMLGDR